MSSGPDDSPWQGPLRGKAAQAQRDDLSAPATQIVTDREAYLGQGRHDIGRRVAEDKVELFITGDVASSLQSEFKRHMPEFITLHDLGTSASLRLLTSLAQTSGSRMQRLSVRRQGHGVALAELQFVEMPLADGTSLRVYSTDLSADGATRTHVAHTLLAYSRLGVLMVGDLAPNALSGQLMPLHEALTRGPWPNVEMLMVPLGSSTVLASQAAQLAGQTAVAVQVTPHAESPRRAWGYVGGAWNRLNAEAGEARTLPVEGGAATPKAEIPRSELATEPMDLHPMRQPAPKPPAQAPSFTPMPTPMPKTGGTSWESFVDRAMLIKGSMACCVFDLHSRQPIAYAGGPPAPERMAQQGATLLSQMNDASRALGLGASQPEASISTTSHHLLLRPIPGHPGVAVFLVLLAGASNLMLAKMQLERVESPS